jgi:hypothetical protein
MTLEGADGYVVFNTEGNLFSFTKEILIVHINRNSFKTLW